MESLPQAINPDLHFFRHDGGPAAGRPTPWQRVYKWWRKACSNLGVEGVDLHGGTRHSKTTALGEMYSEEQLKRHGTMHGSNKAFARYCWGEAKPSRDVYASDRGRLGAKEKPSKGSPLYPRVGLPICNY